MAVVLCPLGNENWEWFVFNVLAAGGMQVEMLHEAHDVARHQSVQIVDEMTRSQALTKSNKDNIEMVDENKMFGLQVKLPGEHHWRITVVNENKDHTREASSLFVFFLEQVAERHRTHGRNGRVTVV